ncbi:MAG: tetratricopeptide repeat protein [Bacteroidia bacterium]
MIRNITLLLCITLVLALAPKAQAQVGAEALIEANRATLERRYDDALKLYNVYINENPEDFRGYFNRGTTRYNAKMFKDAENDFTKTLSLNPIYKEAYYYRSQCFLSQKKYTQAINDCTHVLQSDSNSVPFLKLRSSAYQSNDQSKLALLDLDKAVTLSKLSGDLYKRRAELKVKMHDYDGAIRDYGSVEKLLPKYKMVHFIKGNLYLKINETEFACEEFQLALDNRIVVADRAFESNCQ